MRMSVEKTLVMSTLFQVQSRSWSQVQDRLGALVYGGWREDLMDYADYTIFCRFCREFPE